MADEDGARLQTQAQDEKEAEVRKMLQQLKDGQDKSLKLKESLRDKLNDVLNANPEERGVAEGGSAVTAPLAKEIEGMVHKQFSLNLDLEQLLERLEV